MTATKLASNWPPFDLLWLVVKRDLRTRNRRTVLGVTWIILAPILATSVIVVSLSGVLSGTFGNLGTYSVYTLSGVVFVQISSTGLIGITTSLTGNRGVLTKIRVPRLLFPTASLFSAGIVWLATTTYVIAFAISLSGSLPNIFLPLGMFLYLLFLLGIGVVLASFNARYEDVSSFLPVALQSLVFLTPIFYSPDIWPENFARVLTFNPFYWFVSIYRHGLGIEPELNITFLVSATLISVAVLLVAVLRLSRSWDRDVTYL